MGLPLCSAFVTFDKKRLARRMAAGPDFGLAIEVP
jgi:hypothetical protein